MDRTTDLHPQASRSAPADNRTFMGSIRWIAVAIGLACLALLTMIAGVAHAGSVAPARSAEFVQGAPTPASAGGRADADVTHPRSAGRTERRKPSDR